MQIFSGSSNPSLAKQVADLLGSTGVVEISQFENGEKRVNVPGTVEKQVAVVQSFSGRVDEMIIEFCLIVDALKRQGAGQITGVVPWLGYSKQDKVFVPGEALSAEVIAKIIEATGIKKLITFDLHSPEIVKFFSIPVVELTAKPLLINYFREKMKTKTVVVSPDKGSVAADEKFANELGLQLVQIDKKRDLATGEVTIAGMQGEVEGQSVIIVDDMIVTGATTIQVAKHLKGMGAEGVYIAATHHLYVGGAQEKLDKSGIDEIVVCDTVQCPLGLNSKKLKILSVAQLIVDELSK